MKQKFIPILFLLFAAGCVEKDLIPGGGQVRLHYDWTQLVEDGTSPGELVAYFYSEDSDRAPQCFEGAQLDQALPLARGNYRVLTFNRKTDRMNFMDLSDFDRANASLKPYGTKAGEQLFLPVADWLYGGVLLSMKVDGGQPVEQTVGMSPYVRRVRVEIKTNVNVVDTSYGKLENTAIAVRLKDGHPAPMGNGTTCFELRKTNGGLLADFVIFGVDSTGFSGDELKNKMNIVVEDAAGNRNELNVDVSDEIADGSGEGSKIEEEMAGIGKVIITIDGWENDSDDNSVTETPIRLAACMGVPVRSGDVDFTGKYGVTVGKSGQASGVLYSNNGVTVDRNGHSLPDVPMYYPFGSGVDIFAYAPYAAEPPSVWTVTGDMTADDVLWAKVAGQPETTAEVPLRFEHLLSALRVEVVRGANVAAADFEKTEVYIRNTVITSTLDLKVGKAVVQVVAATEIKAQNDLGSDQDRVVADVMVIPQTVVANQTLICVRVAGVEGANYLYRHVEALVFEAGIRKTIRLTLNDVPATTAVTTKAACPLVNAEITEENF